MQTLSIVIPCFNCQKTIAKCLESVIKSTSKVLNTEILAIDNNSTDDTARIIKSFKEVTYLKEVKQGRSYARNCGIAKSSGTHVAFIDADVVIDEDWAKNLLELFVTRENVGGVQGKIVPIGLDGDSWLDRYRYDAGSKSTNGSFVLLDILCYETPMINSAACMYLKEALEFVGGFDVLLERHEDIDLSKRVFYAGYSLAATKKAEARVYFHGEGVWDYLKRSYAHGKYKVDYLKKWEKQNLIFFSNQSHSISLEDLNTLHARKFLAPNLGSWNLVAHYLKVFGGRLFDLILLKPNMTGAFNLLNALFQLSGIVSGRVFTQKKSLPSDQLIKAVKFKEEFKGMRFIYFDESLAVFDITQRAYHNISYEILTKINKGSGLDL